MKINEIFASIQGEGKYLGYPQVFIRFTGCNLRCSWCDTQYAWEEGIEMTRQQIIKAITKYDVNSVCITGGEPLMQIAELRELIADLKKRGYFIQLETNGTIYDQNIFESVDCVSLDIKPPSSGEESDLELLNTLSKKDQVKVVIDTEADYQYLLSFVTKTPCEIILQPQGNGPKMQWLTKKVIADNLNVRVLPQLHKIVNLP